MSGVGVENGRWITAHKSKEGKVVERDARMADRLYFCDRRRSWIDSPRNSAWQCPQPHKGLLIQCHYCGTSAKTIWSQDYKVEFSVNDTRYYRKTWHIWITASNC